MPEELHVPTLREWGAVQSIKNHLKSGSYGALSAVRFSVSRPCGRPISLFETANALVDAGSFLADSAVVHLHVEKWESGAFILVQHANETTSEIEINLALPNSMPGVYFAKAFCSGGILTNQPLCGFINADGVLLATEKECCLLEPGSGMQPADELDIALYRAEYTHEPAAPDMGLKEFFL